MLSDSFILRFFFFSSLSSLSNGVIIKILRKSASFAGSAANSFGNAVSSANDAAKRTAETAESVAQSTQDDVTRTLNGVAGRTKDRVSSAAQKPKEFPDIAADKAKKAAETAQKVGGEVKDALGELRGFVSTKGEEGLGLVGQAFTDVKTASGSVKKVVTMPRDIVYEGAGKAAGVASSGAAAGVAVVSALPGGKMATDKVGKVGSTLLSLTRWKKKKKQEKPFFDAEINDD